MVEWSFTPFDQHKPTFRYIVMGTRSSAVNEIDKAQKGAVFLAEIKRRLFLEGFTLAIPEPDTGDDLWVVDLASLTCDDDGLVEPPDLATPMLLRCQVKSALPTQTACDRIYTVNFTKSCWARRSRRFYYLIGLHDPELESQFHIGCFPSEYFVELEKKAHLRFNKAGRVILDFFFSEQSEFPKYTLRLKYPPQSGKRNGDGPRADVVEYFDRTTMREALTADFLSGMPSIRLAPDTGRKRGPKPKRRNVGKEGQQDGQDSFL